MNILINITKLLSFVTLVFGACYASYADLYPVKSDVDGTIVLGGGGLDGSISQNFDYDRQCYTRCFCVTKKWIQVNDWNNNPSLRKFYIYDNLEEVVLPEREEDNQFYVNKGDIIGYTNEADYKPPTVINDCDPNVIQR